MSIDEYEKYMELELKCVRVLNSCTNSTQKIAAEKYARLLVKAIPKQYTLNIRRWLVTLKCATYFKLCHANPAHKGRQYGYNSLIRGVKYRMFVNHEEICKVRIK